MSKTKLNEEQYIAELNRQLRAHPEYKHGMEFLSNPKGANGRHIAGYEMVGNALDHPYIEVAHSVAKHFEFDPNV